MRSEKSPSRSSAASAVSTSTREELHQPDLLRQDLHVVDGDVPRFSSEVTKPRRPGQKAQQPHRSFRTIIGPYRPNTESLEID